MIYDVISIALYFRSKDRLQIHRVHPGKEPICPEPLSFGQGNEHREFLLGRDATLHGGFSTAEHDPVEEFLRSGKERKRV